ncbi:putative methyltransferase-domain-containing protein [Ilyonectria robusta]|uniref:putative methyltransferase-domain-containing protein n=1 Tax=Ilyonectria robusta TaxID=1079257 RepID=UPI001E8DB829|nr:putative methyltransferase-domain-containing protein [Ilyonectria robusta]KAH8699502.1 putative methyltransferase-domain-containing protein [Ilyonectria robusta]
MSSPPLSPLLDPVTVSEDLTPLPTFKSIGVAHVDFDGALSQPLQLLEDVRSGCGGQTWPAGMLLAKHMLRYHRDRLKSARILELGAGGGLVGLAVALECELQSPMLVTDQNEMLELMQHNIKLNGLEAKAHAMVLNWGESLPTAVLEQKPDVILAGECVYFEPAFPLLMATLKTLLELNPAATVFFCFKKRRRADMHFVRMAKKAFLVEEIFDEDRPVFQRQGLFLFSFASRTGQQKSDDINGATRLAINGESRIQSVSS